MPKAHKLVLFTLVWLGLILVWSIVVYAPLRHVYINKTKELKSLLERKKNQETLLSGLSKQQGRCADLSKNTLEEAPCSTPQEAVDFLLVLCAQHNVSCLSIVPSMREKQQNTSSQHIAITALGEYDEIVGLLDALRQYSRTVGCASATLILSDDRIRLDASYVISLQKKS